ncbi:serine hydrolase [Nocardioides sp. SR21]|uniref:serine hydrolase domain-containing protein n=1 Tax=Nocardioides sp. SR21 TaxID=2919501 RepID=UPI001FAB27E9|nr:serine hydrolase domain-containing protein [Nocardioides sp. SR21]
MRRWLVAAAVGVVALTGCAIEVEEEVEEEVELVSAPVLGTPGPLAGSSGSFVTAVDGEIVTCEGWGGNDCDTVYDIGSVTKQFTAAAIVTLQSMGRLDVHDRIGRHLDGVPRDKRAITVEQLLTHTSGLVGSLGGDYEPLSRDDLLREAFASELRSEPGSRYFYSNVGYSLLAAIIETASGEGYEQFLARHLFEPAGMTSTGYVLPDWDAADVAVEYDARGRTQGTPLDHRWAADGPYWNLRGNGGILSTARDMYRWSVALDGDGLRELFRPRVREGAHADSWYGYGWVVLDTPLGRVQWHNGGNGWSYAEVTRVPSEDAFAFWVTNRSRGAGWNLERHGLTDALVSKIGRAAEGGSPPD